MKNGEDLMPSIDFYLLNENQLADCYRIICRLIDKAYDQKHTIYIHTNSAEEARTLDELIWTFRDDSFIPHGLNNKSDAPIQLGLPTDKPNLTDILINLTPEIPTFIIQFNRVLEIVPQELKQNARTKYKNYRDQECPITTHDLTKND